MTSSTAYFFRASAAVSTPWGAGTEPHSAGLTLAPGFELFVTRLLTIPVSIGIDRKRLEVFLAI